MVCRLTPIHTPSPSSTSTPEVRVLSSTGVTRHQRSYDPVRLPCRPTPDSAVEAATLVQHGPPPITRLTLPTCRVHYPDGPERVHLSVASPLRSGLPRYSGGSASMTSLSRPAQTSLALQPAGLLNRLCGLCHEASIRPVARPNRSSATRSYRQLPGWILPPLVNRAVWAD